jgi:hypothetical protein
MKKLIFSIVLLISMCALYTEAQTCPGRCINVGGNPSYDSFCPTVGQGGGKVSCNNYETLGCTWRQPEPTIYRGYCQNEGPQREYNELCRNVGAAQGERGCTKYEGMGCVWTPTRAICQ